MFRNLFKRAFFIVIAIAAMVGLVLSVVLYSSRPQHSGEIQLEQLRFPVQVRFDSFGIPDISAKTREDASFALGFVSAGDRLFQMDLVRRKSAGRLAEIFGEVALKTDIRQRHLGFAGAAQGIFDALPGAQQRVLNAYALGVNAYLRQLTALPPEFLLLGYEPEPWTAKDSILVVLSMFQLLSWTGPDERMLTVMDQCLPEAVRMFLTPDSDSYTQILTGGIGSSRPMRSIPTEELASLLRKNRDIQADVRIDEAEAIGSNNWAVNGPKTATGSAILANDMHLPMAVPNIWYRANLRYEGIHISGLILPGVPVVVVGSNGRVAWGFTNFMADVVDLVKLKIDPQNPGQYWTQSGWRALETIEERIRVKGGPARSIRIQQSVWGPVLRNRLLGQPVALHWTATDPAAVDLGLMEMDRVTSVAAAIQVINRAGGPPQNVLLADDQGSIGWTLMGRFPRRVAGFGGTISQFWDQEIAGWEGYLDPAELPRIINPPQGFLATANSRNIGRDYPFVLGHNFAHGYRTFRINQQLASMQSVSEPDLLGLQLDVKTDFYEFYRKLAIALLERPRVANNAVVAEIRQAIKRWDGTARADSVGLPILAAFRNRLKKRVFTPFVKSCAALDKTFRYRWFEMETPLRQLLREKIPATLPDSSFGSWDEFLFAILLQSVEDLKRRNALLSVEEYTWGQYREVRIAHPLSRGLPWLARFLDMPSRNYGGCSFCVRVISPRAAASERMVISPGRPGQGILHMPGGQSGHVLSDHYGDQQPYWASGSALPFMSNTTASELRLVP